MDGVSDELEAERAAARAKVLSSSGAPRGDQDPANVYLPESGPARDVILEYQRDIDGLRDHLAKEVSNLWTVYQRVRDTMRNLESVSEPHRTPRMNEITAFAIVNVADLKSAIQALEAVPGPKLPVYSPPPAAPIGPEVIRRR